MIKKRKESQLISRQLADFPPKFPTFAQTTEHLADFNFMQGWSKVQYEGGPSLIS